MPVADVVLLVELVVAVELVVLPVVNVVLVVGLGFLSAVVPVLPGLCVIVFGSDELPVVGDVVVSELSAVEVPA